MLNEKQQSEIDKYDRAYKDKHYHIGKLRLKAFEAFLREVSGEVGTLLDVSTGRGEVLSLARSLGWIARGTEVVDALLGPDVVYATAWALPFPDRSFNLVSCLDVMEHLLPEDAEPTVRELGRITKSRLVLTISNKKSKISGVEYHVNRRPYPEWDGDIRLWLPDFDVTWKKEYSTDPSEMWTGVRKNEG